MDLPVAIAPIAVNDAILINEINQDDLIENPRDLKYAERALVKEDTLRDPTALSARRVITPSGRLPYHKNVHTLPRYEKKTNITHPELSLDIFNSSDEEFLTSREDVEGEPE